MTITQLLRILLDHEDKYMGQKLGDTAHIITGFEVNKLPDGSIEGNFLGEDPRSAGVIAKSPMLQWLNDHNISIDGLTD